MSDEQKRDRLQCNSPDCFLNFGPQMAQPLKSQINCSTSKNLCIKKCDDRKKNAIINNANIMPYDIDYENIYIRTDSCEDCLITAAIDTGSESDLIDLDLAECLDLAIDYASKQVASISGMKLGGYTCTAKIIIRDVELTITFLAIEKMYELLKISTLISKNTLQRYSEVVGQEGKITLDLKDSVSQNNPHKSRQHSVLITSKQWGLRKEQILKTIHQCLLSNKKQIKHLKDQYHEMEFYEGLKKIVYQCLENNSDVLVKLTSKQLSLVSRFIPAVYLVTSENSPSLQKICDATNLHHGHIDLMTKCFGVRLPLHSQDWEGQFKLQQDERFAEMVGIILGDGSLEYYDLNHPIPKGKHKGNSLTISLNRIDEPEYVVYVADLMESLFKKKPSRYPAKKEKSIRLVLFGRALVEELISHGLVPGNKVKNQVSVPVWIRRPKSFVIKCLKGLIDTDGNFTVEKRDRSIILDFTNASKRLVKDFKSMCDFLGIETSNIRPDKRRNNNYKIRINKRDHLKKFIQIVGPQKWKYRYNYNGMRLIALSDSEKYKKIERDIKMAFPDAKQIQYSKTLEALLKKLCLKYGLNISNKAIDNAIKEAFEFKEFPYRRNHAANWKTYYAQLGSFQAVRRYLELYHNISPRWETIQKHIRIYMTENGQDYNSWFEKIKKKNLRPIVIDKINNVWTVTQFPADLRKIIIKSVWLILNELGAIKSSHIAQMIINDKNNHKVIRMHYLIGEPEYKQAITDYILNLTRLVRKVIQLAKNRQEISPFRLKNSTYLNLPFSRWQITTIINEIKSLYPDFFY